MKKTHYTHDTLEQTNANVGRQKKKHSIIMICNIKSKHDDERKEREGEKERKREREKSNLMKMQILEIHILSFLQ